MVSGLIASTDAFRLAHAAVDTFFGVDNDHVFAFVKAIHGTYLDAILVFALIQASITTYVIHYLFNCILTTVWMGVTCQASAFYTAD